MKTVEELAIEKFPATNELACYAERNYFIQGHHSRDEEVRKLVEVLGELTAIAREQAFDPIGHFHAVEKAKEAIKPYIK